MSLRTWKREFYGNLREATKSDKAALEHALRKWTGLLPENLERHGLKIEGWDVLGSRGSKMQINSTTCALCVRYDADIMACHDCPIYRCDYYDGPYRIWFSKQDPSPMIRALERALKKMEGKR